MIKKNKNGFTLIELLAVIIILGILLLIAVPAVSKYIDNSRKNTYVNSVKSMVDAVTTSVNNLEYGVIPLKNEGIIIPFSKVELEKGSNTKSPYGKYVEDKSYIIVINDGEKFDYFVVALDESGYAIPCINVKELDTKDIIIDGTKIDKNIYGIEQISTLDENQYLTTDELMFNLKKANENGIIKIGINEYYNGTLNDAIASGMIKTYNKDGKKYIELLGDIKLNERFNVGKDNEENMVLVLNGHTLTSSESIVVDIYSGTLEIDGTKEGSKINITPYITAKGQAYFIEKINGGKDNLWIC